MIEHFSTETAYYFDTEPYSRILSLIGEGREHATHKADLLRFVEMSDRELRRTIEHLRRQGVVIISDDNGYYFPADEAGLQAYIAREERRAKSVFYTLKSARQLLKAVYE